MTAWYNQINSGYGTPSRADFVPTGTGYAGVVEFNLLGGGHHATVIVRYDSPTNGFNPITNGMIEGWAHANFAKVGHLDSTDFDVIVLTLKSGRTAASGPQAYDVLELAVGARQVNGKTVLAGVSQIGPQVAVQNMVNDATRLTLP